MEDRSFVNLTTKENLSKINIDSRLIDSFKRVMVTIQEYFNANGYTEQRDYKAYFDEFLLNPDNSKNLIFYLNDEPSKIGAGGFYTRNGKGIHIDVSRQKSNELLDSTLCHEFIHFLVMRGLIGDKLADPSIRDGGFINEALTEMLTHQMYPNSNAYEPQVRMMTFANLLNNKVNNYGLFLKGGIDARGHGPSWAHFVASTKAYQTKWINKPFVLREAIKDELYIKVQRELISSHISSHRILSFDDYVEKLNILMQRPAPDNEFINNFINDMAKYLLSNLRLSNTPLKDKLIEKLKEYKEISESFIRYGKDNIYEFEIAGYKIAIDKERNLYGYNGSYSSSWNPQTGIYTFQIGTEKIQLDMKKINFESWKNAQIEKQREISKYFSKTSKDDIAAISKVAGKDDLRRIEKFQLPAIGNKESSTIYIATYGNRIEILCNSFRLDNIFNINLSEYIGVTSLDPNTGAIYAKPLGNLENGILFTKLSQKFLENRMLFEYSNQLLQTLSSDQILSIITQYKQSDEYDLDDSPEEIQGFALKYYAKQKYYDMSEQERQVMFYNYAKEQEQFVVSSINGKIEVSTLFGTKPKTAFKGKSEILFDSKGKGMYNDLISLLSNTEVRGQSINLPLNPSGDLIIEGEDKVVERKVEFDLLKDYNEQLSQLKSRYEVVGKQIEDLMRQNEINSVLNYQDRLTALIQLRDLISKEMESVIHSKEIVDYERDHAHKTVI